ncbi:MAG: GNAT family N-acetyltransferase [Saprospiraceae bacterium]|nr:GNAT family N-acetyltransferase [Saprospiraceae bacterium]
MIQLRIKHYKELTLEELYSWLQLRLEVFVVEQNCPYQDLDEKDIHCYHALAYEGDQLVAGSRIVPPGISYPVYSSIGRVVSRKDHRGTGAGKLIMKQSLASCESLYPNTPIKISAQSYLLAFYESFGFEKTGDEYLEDDIPHHAMIRPAGLALPD